MRKINLNLKVKKIGKNRLFLYIPRKNQRMMDINFKDAIRLKLIKETKNIEVISKYNYLISLKKEVVKELDIKEKDFVNIVVENINPFSRPIKPLYSNKIDLLYFLPENTVKGSKIVVEEFYKNKTSYLRLCSFHNRGSSFNVEIRRFVNQKLFGKLLGQIQSEGSKTNFEVLEFCNKSLTELKDFLDFIYHLGINKERIFVKLDYHPNIENINEEINRFENFVGLKVNYLSSNNTSGVGFGFKIIIRSTIISQLILNALEKLRLIIETKNNRFKELSDGYLARLLNGDGHFEITSKNRRTIQSRLKIYDGNVDYLNHYKKILENYNFKPYVKEKSNFVRALCNLNLAENLLKIGAFENNLNKDRILFFIQSVRKSLLSKKCGADRTNQNNKCLPE